MVAISGAASRRHFFRAGGPLLLALVVAASGCASSPPKVGPTIGRTHEDKVKDAEDAAEQASFLCGPFFFACAIPAVVVVAGVGKLTEPSDRPSHPFNSAMFLTKLPSSDFSPSGDLLIDESLIQDDGSHIVSGPLLVNLDAPLGDSTKSFAEDIAVHCNTGEVEFRRRTSYDQRYAWGKIVTSQPSSPAIAPGPELDAVTHEFCKFDLKG